MIPQQLFYRGTWRLDSLRNATVASVIVDRSRLPVALVAFQRKVYGALLAKEPRLDDTLLTLLFVNRWISPSRLSLLSVSHVGFGRFRILWALWAIPGYRFGLVKRWVRSPKSHKDLCWPARDGCPLFQIFIQLNRQTERCEGNELKMTNLSQFLRFFPSNYCTPYPKSAINSSPFSHRHHFKRSEPLAIFKVLDFREREVN
jgi:hypothetical protein